MAKTGAPHKTKILYSKKQIVKWTLQMAQIVQTLQKSNILYGDLHFGNLMKLNKTNDLILVDFGFSFVLDRKTGKVVDKACQYKWMTEHLDMIERNYNTPLMRLKMAHEHHMSYLQQNLK